MKKLFLQDDDQVINVDGVDMTLKEIKECVIDSYIYRKQLLALQDMEETA